MSMIEGPLKSHTPDASVHLDAIRGLAALTVFLGHGRSLFLRSGLHDMIQGHATGAASSAQTPASAAEPAAPVDRTNIGHQSVIVFFVLSGYFVGGSVLRATRKGYFTWTNYMFQRLTRLWVALIPALLLGLVLDLCGMHLLHSSQNLYSGPAGQPDIAPGLAHSLTPAVFLGNLFFLQGMALPVFGTNVSLWSLTYEFWYYVFFPLLVTVCLASQRNWVRVLSGALMLLAMELCGWRLCAYFLLWLMGVGVVLLPRGLPERYRKATTFGAGLLFLAGLIAELKYPFALLASDLLLGVLFSGFLWAVLHAQRATVSRFYRRGAQGLSNMSYTLYLVHMPCFVLLSAWLMPVWDPWRLTPRSLLIMLSVYAVVFAVCWVMYLCFERNTEQIRRRVGLLVSRPTGSARGA